MSHPLEPSMQLTTSQSVRRMSRNKYYIDLAKPKIGAPLFFWNVVTNDENNPKYYVELKRFRVRLSQEK